MGRRQVRVSPTVVQAARLRVAVNDRQNKFTSPVTRRVAEARIANRAEARARYAAATPTDRTGNR